MISFSPHALMRTAERVPAAEHATKMIAKAIDVFFTDGYHPNVDFWCKTKDRKCLRFVSDKIDIYLIIANSSVVTVYDRPYAKQLKYATKFKRKVRSRASGQHMAGNTKKWRKSAPYRGF